MRIALLLVSLLLLLEGAGLSARRPQETGRERDLVVHVSVGGVT
jgi:hypothetical protein